MSHTSRGRDNLSQSLGPFLGFGVKELLSQAKMARINKNGTGASTHGATMIEQDEVSHATRYADVTSGNGYFLEPISVPPTTRRDQEHDISLPVCAL